LEILVIFILTFINGFFALSEIALVSVKRQRIEQKAAKGHKGALAVLDLLKQPEQFLSSIQVGITLIGIVSGVYGGATLVEDVKPFFGKYPTLAPYAEQLSYLLVIGIITYFSIVIGELIPKTLSMRNPERIALSVAPVIQIFSKVTFPFVWTLTKSTDLFNKVFGIKASTEDTVTEDEIRYMIKTAGRQGVLEKDESELHQNVFTFTSKRVKDLMTHRNEIDWLDINDTPDRFEFDIRASKRSKFLVCNGDIDKVVGILAVKDFFENEDRPGFDIHKILTEPIYISENKYPIDALKVFQEEKQYIGVVIDEFGVTQGVLTLQDLVEPIFGFLPESDDDVPSIVSRDDGSILVNGTIPVEELNDFLSEDYLPVDENAYQTLAGFILSELDTLPAVGFSFIYGERKIEIVDRDGTRIDKVLITKVKA
jgi:putative hemolysin